MIGVFFILLATLLIYVFIAGTAVVSGKAVYKAVTKPQTTNSNAQNNPVRATDVVEGKPIHQGCLAMNPLHIKEMQTEGKRLTKKQQHILEVERQARASNPVHFDKYEYHVSTNSCIPMVDSIEKLHELRESKAKQ